MANSTVNYAGLEHRVLSFPLTTGEKRFIIRQMRINDLTREGAEAIIHSWNRHRTRQRLKFGLFGFMYGKGEARQVHDELIISL